MTFSIAARSDDGTCFGVAVASKFLAVGSAVPAVRAGTGALATQAWANLAYKADGLRLLAAGHGARETLDTLLGGDEKREERQAGVVDREGNSATFTGSDCASWAGGVHGPGYAIQGNILTGPEVVRAMEETWLAQAGEPSPARRLYAALLAGDRAGGDRRGRQSAALYVVSPGGGYGGGDDVLADLRVDDHPEPTMELGRLLDLHDLYFGKPDPGTLLPLTGGIAEEVAARLAVLGHRTGDLAADLEDWAGIANLEERMVPGAIDPLVLEQLRAQG